MRVAPRVLLGWTPTEVRRTERGPDGAVHTVVTRDSEWDDEQVALVIAAMGIRAAIGPHGQPMDEALSPLADPFRRLPGGYHYVARRRIDFAQKAASDAQHEFSERWKDVDTSADVWTVEKVWND